MVYHGEARLIQVWKGSPQAHSGTAVTIPLQPWRTTHIPLLPFRRPQQYLLTFLVGFIRRSETQAPESLQGLLLRLFRPGACHLHATRHRWRRVSRWHSRLLKAAQEASHSTIEGSRTEGLHLWLLHRLGLARLSNQATLGLEAGSILRRFATSSRIRPHQGTGWPA